MCCQRVCVCLSERERETESLVVCPVGGVAANETSYTEYRVSTTTLVARCAVETGPEDGGLAMEAGPWMQMDDGPVADILGPMSLVPNEPVVVATCVGNLPIHPSGTVMHQLEMLSSADNDDGDG